jgi:hypothetical protein
MRDGLQPDAQLIRQRIRLGADAAGQQKGGGSNKNQWGTSSVHGMFIKVKDGAVFQRGANP